MFIFGCEWLIVCAKKFGFKVRVSFKVTDSILVLGLMLDLGIIVAVAYRPPGCKDVVDFLCLPIVGCIS